MDTQQDFSMAYAVRLGEDFLITPALNEVTNFKGGGTGVVSKIEPKVMRVLMLLISHNNKLVNKEKLVKVVWEDYGGAEEALMQAISKLRKTFGDTPRKSAVIETIPKQGYRMLKPASMLTEEEYQELVGGNEMTYGRPPALIMFWDRLTSPKHLIVLIIVMLLLMGLLGVLYQVLFWM